MLIELSKLQNLPVGALDEGTLIGRVHRVIVNPEDAKIIGYQVWVGKILPKAFVLSQQDVIEIDQSGLVTHTREDLLEKEEVVRINEIIKHKFNLIGLKAVAKNREYLGRITNAVVDTQSGDILRLYVRKIYQELVFERSQIDKITWKEVILKYDPKVKEKAEEPAGVQAEAA
jgi:sporulation protein YlmC with PRC-barrel domain